MAAYGIHADGVIVNVAEASEEFAAEQGWLPLPEGAGIGWRVEGGKVLPPPVPLPTQAELFAYAAQRRWEVETGGITVQGALIGTDDRSKLLILGKRTKALGNPEGTTRWKATEGQPFVNLPNTFIIAAADAVEAHVQACFDKEGEVTAAILSGSITTPEQIAADFEDLSTAY